MILNRHQQSMIRAKRQSVRMIYLYKSSREARMRHSLMELDNNVLFTRSSNWTKKKWRRRTKGNWQVIRFIVVLRQACRRQRWLLFFFNNRIHSPPISLLLTVCRHMMISNITDMLLITTIDGYQSIDFFFLSRLAISRMIVVRHSRSISPSKFCFFIATRSTNNTSFPNRLLLIHLYYSSHMILRSREREWCDWIDFDCVSDIYFNWHSLQCNVMIRLDYHHFLDQ